MEFGLSSPIVQMKEAVSGLANGASKMLGSLLPLRGRSPAKSTARVRPPARIPSGRRVYAVGDIHGRADLLIRLMQDLREDIARGEYQGRPILIFLGDYIDRGFQSKEVIA